MTSQMVVPVAELLRRPGSHRKLSLEFDAEGIGTSDAVVQGPIELRIHMVSVKNGLEVTGTVEAGWNGSCRRCLEPIERAVKQNLQELFAIAPNDEETYPIQDGEADLAPMVRDCLVLSLPIAPLCSEDCAGPAPDAYPMNHPEQPEGDRPRDPRWAALDALRTDQ